MNQSFPTDSTSVQYGCKRKMMATRPETDGQNSKWEGSDLTSEHPSACFATCSLHRLCRSSVLRFTNLITRGARHRINPTSSCIPSCATWSSHVAHNRVIINVGTCTNNCTNSTNRVIASSQCWQSHGHQKQSWFKMTQDDLRDLLKSLENSVLRLTLSWCTIGHTQIQELCVFAANLPDSLARRCKIYSFFIEI